MVWKSIRTTTIVSVSWNASQSEVSRHCTRSAVDRRSPNRRNLWDSLVQLALEADRVSDAQLESDLLRENWIQLRS
jgi:hypothetical protein